MVCVVVACLIVSGSGSVDGFEVLGCPDGCLINVKTALLIVSSGPQALTCWCWAWEFWRC